MNIKRVIQVVVTLALSVTLVVLLATISDQMKRQRGSFLRLFPPHPALEEKVSTLKYNSYYIAGSTRHHVYLGNYTAPLHVLVVNVNNSDTISFSLKVEGIEHEKFWSLELKVDSPRFYLTDGAVPIVYQGDINTRQGSRASFSSTYFQDFQPMTVNSIAIRSLGKPVRENILGKISISSLTVNMKPGILKKQVDGVFCTEGTMHFDKSRNELVYLYLYRNEFIVMDTNLNVLHSFHTIDTTTQAHIKVETIASTGETKFAVPQYIANPASFPAGNLLFVNSRLTARNESANAAEHATAIDVYQLIDGSYKFSFYVYDFDKKERLKGFQIRGDNLYALFDYHLQIWRLRQEFFPSHDLD